MAFRCVDGDTFIRTYVVIAKGSLQQQTRFKSKQAVFKGKSLHNNKRNSV